MTVRWATALVAMVGVMIALLGDPAHGAGDPAAGERAFSLCGSCHTVIDGVNTAGPSLFGIVGRPPAALEGYRYSKGMRAYAESGAVWDEATLDAFLAKPRKLVKGTKMAFAGMPDEAARADLIAYLRSVAP